MPPTIFVIDDHADFAQMLEQVFRNKGYEVERFLANSATIVDRARQEQPAAIILDIAMGDLDGRTICEALRADPTTRPIPVILITAYPDLVQDAGSYGEAAILVKPFSVLKLINLVRSLEAKD